MKPVKRTVDYTMAPTQESTGSLAFSQQSMYDWIERGGDKGCVTRSRASTDLPERKANQISKKQSKAKKRNQRKNQRSQQNSSRNPSGDSISSQSDAVDENSSSPSPPDSRLVSDMLGDAFSPSRSTQPTQSFQPTSNDQTPHTLSTAVEELSKYKVYTQYLESQIESFKTERDLLNGELKDADKIMVHLKRKNKQITLENDRLLKNVSKKSGLRRFTDTSSISTQTDPCPNPHSNDDIATAQFNSICDHITKVAHDLLNTVADAKVTHSTATPPPSSAPSSPVAPDTTTTSGAPFHTAQSRRNRYTAPKQQPALSSNPPTYAQVTDSRQNRRQGQGARYRNKKKVIIVGTSLTEGISSELRSHDIDSTTYKYSGAKIDLIRERVPHLFSKDISKQPDKIVLQAGGNDAEDLTADRTINAYEGLIRDVRKVCPRSKIIISSIPPRKNDRTINNKIKEVNEYLEDRGKRNDNVQFVDVVPVDPDMFTAKKVHFNKKGKSLLASRLKTFLVD